MCSCHIVINRFCKIYTSNICRQRNYQQNTGQDQQYPVQTRMLLFLLAHGFSSFVFPDISESVATIIAGPLVLSAFLSQPVILAAQSAKVSILYQNFLCLSPKERGHSLCTLPTALSHLFFFRDRQQDADGEPAVLPFHSHGAGLHAPHLPFFSFSFSTPQAKSLRQV